MTRPYEQYSSHARDYAKRYESLSAEQVHHSWLHLLPPAGGLALDIGSGSGRDAAYLASRGFEVVAVEPATGLLQEAKQLHPTARIKWLRDTLPALKAVKQLDYRYDVILLSAVWMHVAPTQRKRAFRKLAELLKPSGILVFTLRHGPTAPERQMHPCDPAELERLGRQRALSLVPLARQQGTDLLGREEVHWTTTVFRLPDDGTGALPLLRHVIVNDAKSSTYKLALLRVLVRIADGARGLVLQRDDTHVVIPFGLVALYWLKAFKPLLFPAPDGRQKEYPQQANPKVGLGFVKQGFRELAQISPYDFRLGATFEGTDARHLASALGDICRNVSKMPAHYTTYPESDEPLFQAIIQPRPRVRGSQQPLDREFLGAFGDFRIPLTIWDAMSRYACWIEPAIINAWCELMRGYDKKRGNPRPESDYRRALTWFEAERDTRQIRSLVERSREQGQVVHCVWTGRLLRSAFEIDHCLPFAVWPNNDLWNLMPASRSANQKKSQQLPSAELLMHSRELILTWWSQAYEEFGLFTRFRDEALASLPLAASLVTSPIHERDIGESVPLLDAVFSGLDNQRVRLRADQQVREWEGV